MIRIICLALGFSLGGLVGAGTIRIATKNEAKNKGEPSTLCSFVDVSREAYRLWVANS